MKRGGKKSIIVTGSRHGVGFYVAKNLAKKYPEMTVVITSRKESTLSEALKKMKSEFGVENVVGCALDLTSEDSIGQFIEFIKKNFDSIEIMVNNAACLVHSRKDKLEESDTEEAARITFQTNVFGPFALTQGLYPLMNAKAGKIIVVSSISQNTMRVDVRKKFHAAQSMKELRPLIEEYIEKNAPKKTWYSTFDFKYLMPIYAMSKMCISVTTRILAKQALEDRDNNILVCCCHPGFVATAMSLYDSRAMHPEEGSITPVHLAINGTREKHHGLMFEKKNEVISWFGEYTGSLKEEKK